MFYFAVLRQYEFNNLEIIISQRKKPLFLEPQDLKRKEQSKIQYKEFHKTRTKITLVLLVKNS
jgi:hypothetical protein